MTKARAIGSFDALADLFVHATQLNRRYSQMDYHPNPMGFLSKILDRPKNERPYLIVVTGYPAIDAEIPRFATFKKPLEEIATFV